MARRQLCECAGGYGKKISFTIHHHGKMEWHEEDVQKLLLRYFFGVCVGRGVCRVGERERKRSSHNHKICQGYIFFCKAFISSSSWLWTTRMSAHNVKQFYFLDELCRDFIHVLPVHMVGLLWEVGACADYHAISKC